jgi:hypothetical protein
MNLRGKRHCFGTAFVIGLLFLSLTLVSVAPSSFSVHRINDRFIDKPAGTPGKGSGGGNGGGGKENTIEYELFVEIDYMAGHEPTGEVLTYIHDYYSEKGIEVTIYVSDLVPLDESVTDADFWAIEAEFNDVIQYDDRAHGDVNSGVFYSKEKWVLFGTVDAAYGAVGYTWANTETGNYIFIADQTGDEYADEKASQGVTAVEVEAVVLMHELGHSIGILKLRLGAEFYDNDLSSVMSWLNPNNCNAEDKKGNPDWHYSKSYWKLRNVEYYRIEA